MSESTAETFKRLRESADAIETAAPHTPARRRRLDGWESALNETIASFKNRPYVLGESDCLSFACACYAAITGIDHWPDWKGKYDTRRGALLLLAGMKRNLEDAVSGLGGLERVPLTMARRGDVMIYKDARGPHIGVCVGAHAALYADDGIEFLPMTAPGIMMALAV